MKVVANAAGATLVDIKKPQAELRSAIELPQYLRETVGKVLSTS